MAAATRLYYLSAQDGEQHLVEAASQAQALRHVVANRFSIHVPDAKYVAGLVAQGVKVEIAKNGDGE